jgi:hypothetical protein
LFKTLQARVLLLLALLPLQAEWPPLFKSSWLTILVSRLLRQLVALWPLVLPVRVTLAQ